MSKKASKRRKQSRPVAKKAPVPAATPAPAAVAAAQQAPAASKATTGTADIAGEYHYVISDLKRIGVLAASMFGLLIVLALAAQYVF